jgi:hypothetical protein
MLEARDAARESKGQFPSGIQVRSVSFDSGLLPPPDNNQPPHQQPPTGTPTPTPTPTPTTPPTPAPACQHSGFVTAVLSGFVLCDCTTGQPTPPPTPAPSGGPTPPPASPTPTPAYSCKPVDLSGVNGAFNVPFISGGPSSSLFILTIGSFTVNSYGPTEGSPYDPDCSNEDDDWPPIIFSVTIAIQCTLGGRGVRTWNVLGVSAATSGSLPVPGLTSLETAFQSPGGQTTTSNTFNFSFDNTLYCADYVFGASQFLQGGTITITA